MTKRCQQHKEFIEEIYSLIYVPFLLTLKKNVFAVTMAATTAIRTMMKNAYQLTELLIDLNDL